MLLRETVQEKKRILHFFFWHLTRRLQISHTSAAVMPETCHV